MSNARSESPEPLERFLNIPGRQPSAKELKHTSSRGAGTITFAPTEKESRGEVLLDEGVSVHVPMRVIENAHHRPAFVIGAWIDISHRRERSGVVAIRINQIVKQKKRA